MFPHETPTFQHLDKEKLLGKVGAEQGRGLGALSISTWTLKMEGSGFPDVLRWGSEGEGLNVAVTAWGGGPE